MKMKIAVVEALQIQLVVCLLLVGFVTFGESVKLRVKSDGDTILDSEISFGAWLENPDRDYYDIEWIENYPKASKKRYSVGTLDATNNYQSNFTLPYKQNDGYSAGQYTVTVTVSYQLIFYFTVDTKVLHYKITPNFEGNLKVDQPDVPKQEPNFISTKKEAEFSIEIHDKSKFLDTAMSVNYTWSRNNTLIASTTLPKLNMSITQEGLCQIQANITAEFNSTTKEGVPKIMIKNGTFNLNVSAKVPIQNFGYSGATWFRHGKLLDLKVTCQGTPPYTYCWHIISGPYNRTGNETCVFPSVTNECEFPITRYFSDIGMYTLLIIMNNDVSSLTNQSSINVYKATHKPQLSIIVVPISCTIIAIVLIIFGVAYYWENHVRYTVEVAHFDFQDSMGITRYVTIVDRIRDTIYTWTSRRGGDNLLRSLDDDSSMHAGYGSFNSNNKITIVS